MGAEFLLVAVVVGEVIMNVDNVGFLSSDFTSNILKIYPASLVCARRRARGP